MKPRTPWRCLALASLLLVSTTSHAQTKLRAWNIHPDGYPVTEALKRFASLVAQGT
ncbi:hypothetical protein [Rhodoferax sp. OV413]|uniref:hypothetical protein n=1 Tax=Rhodoferax sp. OV413 TaxID=1855285 RepID=UPI0025E2DAAF|nr:hypothetical protein [Rhodoferax sp. OV413]